MQRSPEAQSCRQGEHGVQCASLSSPVSKQPPPPPSGRMRNATVPSPLPVDGSDSAVEDPVDVSASVSLEDEAGAVIVALGAVVTGGDVHSGSLLGPSPLVSPLALLFPGDPQPTNNANRRADCLRLIALRRQTQAEVVSAIAPRLAGGAHRALLRSAE